MNTNIVLLCLLEKSGPEDLGLFLLLKCSSGLQMGLGRRRGTGTGVYG
jgi:hypothetical protein